MATRVLTFPNDFTPLDLLLFTTYKREVGGLVEATLAANPGLAALGPCPPRGTQVTVTDPPARSQLAVTNVVRLFD